MVRIGIIGSGRIGGNAGKLFAKAGHEVMFSFSRDAQKLRGAGSRGGQRRPRGHSGARRPEFGEVVVLSVPWALVDEALEAAGPLDGKVLIDTTNQFGRDEVRELRRPGSPRWPERRRVQRPSGRGRQARQGVQHHDLGLPGRSRRKDGTGPRGDVLRGRRRRSEQCGRRSYTDSGFDPVYVGSLTGDVVWMEPPRREGALYGEEFHLQEARETVARLTGRLRTVSLTVNREPLAFLEVLMSGVGA